MDFSIQQSIALLSDVLKRPPLGFLLGAGCPASVLVDSKPLIPTIAPLTKYVYSAIEGTEKHSLAKIRKRLDARHEPDPNIERLLSYIRTFATVVVPGDSEDVSANEIAALDVAICNSIKQVVQKALPKDTAYHRFAAWAQAASATMSVQYFTTNYDLLLEEALELYAVPYFDGFIGSYQPLFDLAAIENDEFPRRWARLWKLHGSVNWQLLGGRVVRSNLDADAGLLIYPSHLKYDEGRRLPYLAMQDRLTAFLRQPKATLVTCGFSFADQHLTDIIASCLRGNPSATLFALMFSNIEENLSLYNLAKKNSAVSALYSDGAVIGTLRGNWDRTGIVPTPPRASLVGPESDGVRFTGGNFDVFSEFLGQMAHYEKTSAATDPNTVPMIRAALKAGSVDSLEENV